MCHGYREVLPSGLRGRSNRGQRNIDNWDHKFQTHLSSAVERHGTPWRFDPLRVAKPGLPCHGPGGCSDPGAMSGTD